MGLLALFLLTFFGAITPGPDVLLIVRNTLRFGFLSGIKVFIGILSGCVIYLFLIYFGFVCILSGVAAQIILCLFGAYYLLYVSFQLFRKKPTHIVFNFKDKPDTYLKALIINLSNPKAILFFSVIVSPFIHDNPFASYFVVFCGLGSAFILVIILATCFRQFINDSVFYIIDKICAFLFVCFAFLLLYRAYGIMLPLINVFVSHNNH